MKKIICWLLSLSMLFTVTTSTAVAEDTSTDFLTTLREKYVNTAVADKEIFENIAFSENGFQYDKFEIKFDLNLGYTNPFDPDDISVNGIFTYPDGTTATLPAFYMEEMKYKKENTTLMTYNANNYINLKNNYWCLRFSGDVAGDYTFCIQAQTSDGSVYFSDTYNFEILTSQNNGFIDVSKENPEYFIDTADNSLFYGAGSNIAWVRDQFTLNPDHRSYEYFINQAANAETNITRVWLCHWAWLEWMPQENSSSTYSYAGLGYYNQCISSALDNIFRMCEEKGLRIILTLDDNNEQGNSTDENSNPTYDSWAYNPYNVENGGPALDTTDYWSNQEVREYYKNRLRYIIARWGYSSSLMSLNLWNDTTTPTDAIVEYLNELNDYTNELTENYRPLLFASNYRYEANDVLDYGTHNTANGNGGLNKPLIVQECYYSDDNNYFKSTLKNTIWDELFSFSASTMVWSHDTVDQTNSWGLFTGLLNFANKLSLHKSTYLPHYNVKQFASTWAVDDIKPNLSIENNRLAFTTSKVTSYVTVNLKNSIPTASATDLVFDYDATNLTKNANMRINIQYKVDGGHHIYMPWFKGTYYFTPEGEETQTLTVSGNNQWSSFLKVVAGTKGTYRIPLSTFNIPENLISSSDVNDSYKHNIFDNCDQPFEFVIQQQSTSENSPVIYVDNIAWVGDNYLVSAQDFSDYTAEKVISVDYPETNTQNFKNITAKALGDVSGYKDKATENQFYINETDSDLLLAGIAPKLYGTNEGIAPYRNDPTFTVNCSSGGTMVVELSEIGSGTNCLTFTQNGEIISQTVLTGGRRYVTEEERYISIELSPGKNVITISNEGNDWIDINAYHFKFYTEDQSDCVSIKRMISEKQQLALLKNSKSGEIYQKVLGGVPNTALNVSVPFYSLKNRDYRFEIYDTQTGLIEKCEIITVTNNSFVATIPQVEDTKALKLTEYAYGDANDDGKFNATDIVRLKKHIAGIKTSANYDNSDADFSGKLDVSDIAFLRNELLK